MWVSVTARKQAFYFLSNQLLIAYYRELHFLLPSPMFRRNYHTCKDVRRNKWEQSSKMAWRVEVPITKSDSVTSIPKTHVMEGEKQLLQRVF